MAWGFSDPNIQLPAEQVPGNATETMFLASIGIVLRERWLLYSLHMTESVEIVRVVFSKSVSHNQCLAETGIYAGCGPWMSVAFPVVLLLLFGMFLVYRTGM